MEALTQQTVKQCSKFKCIQLKSNFCIRRRATDGLQPECRTCKKRIETSV